jgi:glycosyltransferase involved in cell wall biosynthesis
VGVKVAADCRALRPPVTGIGQFLRGLLPALQREVDLVPCVPRVFRDLAPAGIRVEAGPAFPGSMWFHGWFRHADADVLFCPLGVRPWRADRPCVAVIHDLSVLRYPGWQSFKNRATVLPFLEDTVRGAAVVVPCRAVADEVRRFFPGSDPVVIPHGLDAPRPGAWTAAPLPSEFFLFLGTMEPRKNLALCLEVWKADPSLPPLVVAGAPGWKVRLPRLPRNVVMAGYVDEAGKDWLLDHCLALLYPSSYEGFGLPVAEAAVRGVPVLATAVPATEEYTLPSWIRVKPEPGSVREGVRRVLGGAAVKEPARVRPWIEAARDYAGVLTDAARRP